MSDEYCEWIYDQDIDAYETGCDETHCFETGTVYENNHVFCPYCGKHIRAEVKK
jgi:hypothetical protein